MPTENRSSNPELQQIEAAGAAMTQIRTMLGREQRPDQVAAALEACDWSGTPIGNKAIILSAIRALRAPQHQGEPVALPARKVHHLDPSFLHDGDKGWNACLDEIAKLGQLYTHADPGEVERLRAALKFYADREHYHFESGKWDTVSGEPLNILWCGDEPDFIEDGAVARAVLEDKPS
ncbi:hypothetical protein [Pseudomonas guariconensis]|uniref:hypothetical protein n=1 Tax=Pseudomonas guariconensis TaxID=1288410 RepID=UPI0034658011